MASPSFFFNAAQSVFDNDYIGLGSNSASFIRNTSVVPVDCVLKSIAFSARGAFSSSTATVYLQPAGSLTPVATTLSATIIFGGYFSIMLIYFLMLSVGKERPDGAATGAAGLLIWF